MTYGHDLFQLAFRRYQSHGGIRKTARAVNVSPSTISRWVKRSNWVASKKRRTIRTRRRSSPKLTPEVCKFVLEFFKDPAFQCTTARSCAHRLLSTHGKMISLSSMRRCIRKVGLSRKRLSGKILGISNPQLVDVAWPEGPLHVSDQIDGSPRTTAGMLNTRVRFPGAPARLGSA